MAESRKARSAGDAARRTDAHDTGAGPGTDDRGRDDPAADRAQPTSPKVLQIQAAARKVFMRDGFGTASMDAIAREAGVSKATLYAHFSGKEALFAAIVRERCAGLVWIRAVAELDRLEPREALRRIARDFCELVHSPEVLAMHRVVLAEAPRLPEVGRVFFELGPVQLRLALASYLANATARGQLDVPEPLRAAEQFTGMLIGHFHLGCLLGVTAAPSRQAIEQVVELDVELFIRGYAPR